MKGKITFPYLEKIQVLEYFTISSFWSSVGDLHPRVSFGPLTPILRCRRTHQKVPSLDKDKYSNILKLELRFIILTQWRFSFRACYWYSNRNQKTIKSPENNEEKPIDPLTIKTCDNTIKAHYGNISLIKMLVSLISYFSTILFLSLKKRKLSLF